MNYVFIVEWRLYDEEDCKEITAPSQSAFASEKSRSAFIIKLHEACDIVGIKHLLKTQLRSLPLKE